jgi:carbon-monoxide dehydrogenase large subunit
VTTTTTVLGHAVQRREDPALLVGEARYLDDIRLDGLLHAAFVRSPYAHAVLGAIDISDAAAGEGVIGVFTNDDLGLPPSPAMGNEAIARPMLASGRVRFVGEAVAVAVAETRALAVDAAERIVVEYEPLAAVVDVMQAIEPGAPVLFEEHGSNVVADREPRDIPDFFEGADVVLRARNRISRVAPVTMEPNGCLAVPSEDGNLLVYASTQSVFGVQREIANALKIEPETVRVVAPSVGGGFGAKGGVYPESIVIAAVARRLGRPVAYAETRTENILAMTNGRGQVQDVEIGVKRDGTVVALRAHLVGDAGAYANRAFPPMVGRVMASGPYRIPKIDVRVTIAVTNCTPTGPYRGAGRPEAAALLERSMDVVARELDLDPVEVRKRNFIPPDAFPYETPTRATYDSGDYEKALDAALEIADYEGLRREQAARRERGDRMQLGIGIGSYVEISGGGSEFGSVTVEPDGSVTVVTGSIPNGQGHETVFAQVASAVLGVPMERVRVLHSDTDVVARGTGSFGSRSLQVGGSAVHDAAAQVLDLARRKAAEMLEAAEADIVAHDGGLGVAGSPSTTVSWEELAANGDLKAELDFAQDGTFPFGTHVAVVEVDVETGDVRLVRMVAVDDCGRVINPMLVEGQVHGGIAQGSAQVLFEGVFYDADGNPLTSTLLTYGMPSAAELPRYETAHTETPTPKNPLGAKGVGESGTTGSLSAVWNAVIDALSPYGVTDIELPATPERVWRAINESRYST